MVDGDGACREADAAQAHWIVASSIIAAVSPPMQRNRLRSIAGILKPESVKIQSG
jgi:hypothetical protein